VLSPESSNNIALAQQRGAGPDNALRLESGQARKPAIQLTSRMNDDETELLKVGAENRRDLG